MDVDVRQRVYVHPIMPILNETRGIVMQYNAEYERRVRALPGEYASS